MKSACAVLYCNLWPVWLYDIFQYLITNGTGIRKKVIEHKMCVLIFSTPFVYNISHSKQNSARYCHNCTQVFTQSTRYSYRILMSIVLYRQIFEKIIKYHIFMKILSVGADLFQADKRMDRRTDRHDKANSRFSQFCERA